MLNGTLNLTHRLTDTVFSPFHLVLISSRYPLVDGWLLC